MERKKEAGKFELHTSKEDRLKYYRSLRSIYIPIVLLSIAVLIDRYFFHVLFDSFNNAAAVLALIILFGFSVPILLCQLRINWLNKYLDE